MNIAQTMIALPFALLSVFPQLAFSSDAHPGSPGGSERWLLPAAPERAVKWRYTFQDPGKGFAEVEFDDRGWNEGPSGFGTEGTPGAVVGTRWQTPEIWIRTAFEHDGKPLKIAALKVHHDEDLAVWVNGKEILSLGGWTTEYRLHDATEALKGALRSGKNVAAARCRQTSGGQYLDVGIVLDPEKEVLPPAMPLPPLKPLFDFPLRDTSICLAGDVYYLTGTTGFPTWWETNEGIRVWKSADLKDWEPLGLVWTFEKDGTWQKEFRDRKRAIWAPEIHFLKGTFWLAYCVNYGGTGILRSSSGKAEGPYADVKPGGPLTGEIDASLFEDRDGKVYFVFQNGKIARLKDEMTGLAEEPRLLVPSNAPQVGFEGAFLTMIESRYHLICADFIDGDYHCMEAVSDSLLGPYGERSLAVPHGGHNMLFRDRDGRWWSTFFGNDPRSPFRERPAILRIELDEKGRVRPEEKAGERPVRVRVDGGAPGEPLRHVWQYFGYDECNFTTGPAARELMRTLARTQPEPVYLRQHFLLASGDGTPSLKWGSTNAYTEDAAGNPIYDWTILDRIFDALTASGCRPLVEIGFMPRDLSAKPDPYRLDTFGKVGGGVSQPPRDYGRWADLIRAWARHSAGRYPDVESTWWWELWNEPNIGYWQGTFEEYSKLYDFTESALHEVLPRAVLGGPHTVGSGKDFLRRFLEHCARGTNAATGRRGTRLDYVGFHSKGSTRIADGHVRMSLAGNLAMNREAFATVASFPEFRRTPIIIGECDPEGAAALSARAEPANGYRNGSAYGAYEVALMKHTLDLAGRSGVDLRGVLTWAFLFDDKDCFEGFRTLSTNGIHKPVLNAFKLLGMLRGRRVPLESSGALGADRIIREGVRGDPDIDGLAAASAEGAQVLLWNYNDDIVPAPPASIRLEVKAPREGIVRAQVTHWRIDGKFSNAHALWLELGSPPRPSPEVLERLREAGELDLLEPPGSIDLREGRAEIAFPLPRHGVSLVEIRWGPEEGRAGGSRKASTGR